MMKNIRQEKDNMTKTTYEKITDDLDEIASKIHQIGEQNDLIDLSFLSSQLGAVKENLKRLLWIELPELNDTQKLNGVSKNTGMIFNPGIFEVDAMRQAFFKRQAKAFFDNEDERQNYINYTEEQYLTATGKLKQIYRDTKEVCPSGDYRQKMTHVKGELERYLGEVSA